MTIVQGVLLPIYATLLLFGRFQAISFDIWIKIQWKIKSNMLWFLHNGCQSISALSYLVYVDMTGMQTTRSHKKMLYKTNKSKWGQWSLLLKMKAQKIHSLKCFEYRICYHPPRKWEQRKLFVTILANSTAFPSSAESWWRVNVSLLA